MASPSSVTAGATIIPAFQVAVLDDEGNTVTGSDYTVTVSITSGTGAPGAVLGGTVTRTAVNGVATFDDLTIDRVGSGYTLTATSGQLGSASSSEFTVNIGSASRLVFTTQPSNLIASTTFSPPVEVMIQDAAGNPVTSSNASVTVAIAGGTGAAGAILSGTLTRGAVNGVATFDDLTVDKASPSYRLTATGPGLTSASSANFDVLAASASRLVVTTQPGATATAGAVINPALRVTVQDANGNTVSGANASMVVSITPGTGTAGAVLGGTLTQAVAGGVAMFGDLTLDKVGTYTLTVSAAGLLGTTTSAITVTAGLPGRLVISAQPASVASGAATTMQVAVEDDFGNPVSGTGVNVSVAITPGTGEPGAVLGGTLIQPVSAGVATFNDLTIDKAGVYSLTVSAPGLLDATSDPYTVSAAAPGRLVFTVQPSSVVSGVAIAPAVQVTVQDNAGNPVTTPVSVTVAITAGSGAAGAVLAGTVTQATSGSVAAFGDLTIDKAATGYTLTATAPGIAGVASAAFAVTPGTATKLIIEQPTAPFSERAGHRISPPVRVVIQDAAGNIVTDAVATVSIAITSGTGTPGAVLKGTLALPAVNGVVIFDDLEIDLIGSNYSFTVTATGLVAATSVTFNITP